MNSTACIAFFWVALSVAAFGQTVGGVTRDSSSGNPLAGVQITAHNLNKGVDLTTVSNTDGKFTFTSLEPGVYEFEAVKDGFQKSSVRAEIDTQAARVELPLQLAPGYSAPLTAREKEMLERIERLEQRLAAMEAASNSRDANGTENTSQPLVASLSPLPSFPPTTQSPQSSQAPGTPQTGPQQSGGRSGPIATPPAPVAPAEHRMPDALQTPEAVTGVDNQTPFAFGDFSWLNGSARTKDTVLDTKFFTPEIRFDTNYIEDFNQPIDHTIVGSTESFRSGEVQIEQASVGGDFHWENVRGRILFMEGLFATTTPRNDASSATGSGNGNTGGVGQWDLQNAYKYVSEAYGGYHFNVQHGLNIDAGIFVSYIGLFSYYNFDNWTYHRLMFRPIRRGSLTACACSGSQPTS
jgi:hypothetical protein